MYKLWCAYTIYSGCRFHPISDNCFMLEPVQFLIITVILSFLVLELSPWDVRYTTLVVATYLHSVPTELLSPHMIICSPQTWYPSMCIVLWLPLTTDYYRCRLLHQRKRLKQVHLAVLDCACSLHSMQQLCSQLQASESCAIRHCLSQEIGSGSTSE